MVFGNYSAPDQRAATENIGPGFALKISRGTVFRRLTCDYRPNKFDRSMHCDRADAPYTFSRQSIRGKKAFYFPVGKGITGFIDTRDVALMAAKVLLDPEKHLKKTYSLTGSEALSYGDAASIISSAISKTVTYVDLPEDHMVKTLQDSGIPNELIDQMMSLYAIIERNKPSSHKSILSTAVKDLTGKDPTTLHEFAREYAALWQ